MNPNDAWPQRFDPHDVPGKATKPQEPAVHLDFRRAEVKEFSTINGDTPRWFKRQEYAEVFKLHARIIATGLQEQSESEETRPVRNPRRRQQNPHQYELSASDRNLHIDERRAGPTKSTGHGLRG
jgi:hypothetical protein